MSEYTETMNKSKTTRATYIVEHDKESGITSWIYIPEEKKEKDMKETNLEHYKEQLKSIFDEYYKEPITIIKKFKAHTGVKIPCYGFESCTDAILNWMAQPYKEQILDDAEREYLSAVIKPYKNKVISIMKAKDGYEIRRFIIILIKGNYGKETINLPWFKGNAMYKGMKDFKGYTVEELGL